MNYYLTKQINSLFNFCDFNYERKTNRNSNLFFLIEDCKCFVWTGFCNGWILVKFLSEFSVLSRLPISTKGFLRLWWVFQIHHFHWFSLVVNFVTPQFRLKLSQALVSSQIHHFRWFSLVVSFVFRHFHWFTNFEMFSL